MEKSKIQDHKEITVWTPSGDFAGFYPDPAAAALALFGSDSPVFEYLVATAGPRDVLNNRLVRPFGSLRPSLKLMVVALDDIKNKAQ